MLPKKKIEGLVKYWVENSQEKFKTMQELYSAKRYSDCLYYGHMILEMALKALAVRKIEKPVPKTHNLRHLIELAELDLGEDEIKLIAKANEFNMEARYPEEKMQFYKLCTKNYTDLFYKSIISLYKKLCQKAK
ncbi:MAG: HEPN domain-containing protein [Candidatus Peregrinibacteria bacterium]